MQVITHLGSLQAISGGFYAYSYDRYVTENVILLECTLSGLAVAPLGAMLGIFVSSAAPQFLLPLGVAGAASGFYFGYTMNDYYDLEPNQWITVDVFYEYY